MLRRTPATIARWKGQADQPTTTVDSARHTHCHQSNCREGIICIATTGRPKTTAMMSRQAVTSSRAVCSTSPARASPRRRAPAPCLRRRAAMMARSRADSRRERMRGSCFVRRVARRRSEEAVRCPRIPASSRWRCTSSGRTLSSAEIHTMLAEYTTTASTPSMALSSYSREVACAADSRFSRWKA